MAQKQGGSEQDSPGKNYSGEGPNDFSLIGGPVFRLLRKSHLSGDNLELVIRRVVVISLFAWLPLLLLSTTSKADLVSFLQDVEVHFRFLLALPALIVGEVVVHRRIRFAVSKFVERPLVSPDDMPRFEKAIESAVGLRNSTFVQIALLILVYTLGLWLWDSRIPIVAPTWYAMPGGRWHLTVAGYWYVFVSIPIVQFLLLSWYWRFLVWCRLLWQVSRIQLILVSTHPDHCAGLAFLGRITYAFGPILFAQGAMLAGVVASRVLYRGESLMSFKLEIGAFVAFFVLAVLGPLLFFTPQLVTTKRKGLTMYAQLGQNYVLNFERKWIPGDRVSSEDPLGTSDIQSLADLANSYSVVSSMRLVPFGLRDITRLAVVTAAPLSTLLLTVFSLEELIIRLIKIIF